MVHHFFSIASRLLPITGFPEYARRIEIIALDPTNHFSMIRVHRVEFEQVV